MKKELIILVIVLLLLPIVDAAVVEDKVVEKLDKENEVRVIVKLKEDAASGKSKAISLNAKKERIAAKQEKVLSKVRTKGFALRHKYSTINSFSGKITKQALEELKNNPDVEFVYIDKPVKLFLSASAPQVNATSVWNLTLNGINLTGTGETVCIVDTGIDYTHSALGACSVAAYTTTGTNESYILESAHNYSDNFDYTWNITKPGYSRIAVHFNNISLEYQGEVSGYDTYDRITIYDYSMKEIASYHGINGIITDLWTPYSEGDTIYIRLESDVSMNDYGFYIDQIRNGTTNTTYNWSSCSKVVGGWDFVNNDGDPIDDNNHGTHVAGIVASTNETHKGIAPDAKLAAAKVLDSAGNGWTSDVIAGIDWCTNRSEDLGISVISMSLGGGGPYNSYCNDDEIAPSINAAVYQNISVIIASGNDGWTNGISSPACVQNATAVGSVTKADAVSSFTNRGAIFEILAPGGTLSGSGACPTSNYICSAQSGGGFIGYSGTSMATPHVAGAAALMQQFYKLQNNNQTLTPQEIENTLNSTGKTISSYSRIDILAAIKSLDEIAPQVNFSLPTPSNGSVYSKNVGENISIEINATINDSINDIDSCILEFDGINESMAKTGSGNVVYCYINKSTDKSGIITYKVYANDSKNNFGYNARQIRINHIPSAISAYITSTDSLNRTNGTLIGTYDYSDLDNDSIIQNETKWYNNSAEVSALANKTQVNYGNLSKGNVLLFSVRAYDGANWSSWANSSNFTVRNAAPYFSITGNLSVNETSYVNITVNAADIDNDNMTYAINNTRFFQTGNKFSWLTNLSDSGTYSILINVSDETETTSQNYTVVVTNEPDTDNDGNPDYNDTDDDNDGIDDSSDYLKGNSTTIDSTIAINLFVNGSDNISKVFNETYLVNITDDDNNSLIEFSWNFTNSTLALNFTIEYAAENGTILVRGLDLSSTNYKKTVYMNKSSSSNNYVCIADDETTDIALLPSDCSGYTKVQCSGSSGQYTCTDLTGRFEVTGLSHSAVKGIYVSSGGGGGGGGGTKIAVICNESWLCTSWSECKAPGIQSRICTDLNSCGTTTSKPEEMQTCILPAENTANESAETEQFIKENKTEPIGDIAETKEKQSYPWIGKFTGIIKEDITNHWEIAIIALTVALLLVPECINHIKKHRKNEKKASRKIKIS